MQAAFSSNPRQARASERRAQIAQKPAVDPGDADAQLFRDAVPAFQIRGPHGSGQAIFRVVCHRDSFFFSIERRDVAHRPENFLLHAASGFGQAGENGWLNIETAISSVAKFGRPTTRYDRSSF